MATFLGLGITRFELIFHREKALLGAFKTERVGNILLFIAIYASTILLVTLILKAARLEAEHLGRHHADQLG